MLASPSLRCNARTGVPDGRVTQRSRRGCRARRRLCTVRAAEDKGYFSEAEPEKGLQPLWGQPPKRDLVKEVRACTPVAPAASRR